MLTPTPRQQAGYLRRLLRRGEIQIVDATSGTPQRVLVEIHGDLIRLVPVAPALEHPSDDLTLDSEPLRWASLFRRLQRALPLLAAEELVRAVELEVQVPIETLKDSLSSPTSS